jgi:4-alpha-glucanotransferase
MTERSDRQSGLVIPLFSCPSSASWGIGEIGDLAPLTAWLAAAGQRVLQLLPINEMAPAQYSPYSAISAMAIDPLFISVPEVPEFAVLGGEASLSSGDRALLQHVRQASRIDYANVRRLKQSALRAAFDAFYDLEWRHDTSRARDLKAFKSSQAWWVEDYSLFRAIHAREDERCWTDWPEALRRRTPEEIDRTRRELAREVLFYQYVQWVAAGQWRVARAHTSGVALYGDLAFMVDGDSADVWSRQHQFRLDAAIGAPPDAFSETGQNWGLPLYRWDVIAGEDFLWLRERARRSADLYDGYRIDHLVGFYRTFAWSKDGSPPFFTPDDEPTQTALGERLIQVFREPGATIIAEDLGTVPDFVRASLARLAVPGFRVFRWERDWHSEGQPFRDPGGYPPVSVAATGTHDTETLAVWWDSLPFEDRRKISDLAIVHRLTEGADVSDAAYNPVVRDVLLETLFASGSNLLLLPVQDVFGWDDRINEPGIVADTNWTYRLPWPTDRLADVPEAHERQLTLARWARTHGR